MSMSDLRNKIMDYCEELPYINRRRMIGILCPLDNEKQCLELIGYLETYKEDEKMMSLERLLKKSLEVSGRYGELDTPKTMDELVDKAMNYVNPLPIKDKKKLLDILNPQENKKSILELIGYLETYKNDKDAMSEENILNKTREVFGI